MLVVVAVWSVVCAVGAGVSLQPANKNTNATKGNTARRDRLRESGLTPAHDAGQEAVGVGEDAGRIQHPRVVNEARAAPGVLADQDALRTQPSLGQERVRARDDVTGRLVRLHSQSSVAAQRLLTALATLG